MFELVTGKPPWIGENPQALYQQIVADDLPLGGERRVRVPRDLRTIIEKATAKNPQRRYATARDLGEDIRRFLHHEPVLARRPTPMQRGVKLARRHPGWAAVVSLLLVALSAWSFVYYRTPSELLLKGGRSDWVLRLPERGLEFEFDEHGTLSTQLIPGTVSAELSGNGYVTRYFDLELPRGRSAPRSIALERDEGRVRLVCYQDGLVARLESVGSDQPKLTRLVSMRTIHDSESEVTLPVGRYRVTVDDPSWDGAPMSIDVQRNRVTNTLVHVDRIESHAVISTGAQSQPNGIATVPFPHRVSLLHYDEDELIARASDLELIWRTPCRPGFAPPSVVRTPTGAPIVVAPGGYDCNVHAIDLDTGRKLWTRETAEGAPTLTRPVITDLNGDGRPEVAVVTHSTPLQSSHGHGVPRVFTFDLESGERLESVAVDASLANPRAIAHGEQHDLLVGSISGTLYRIGFRGGKLRKIWQYASPEKRESFHGAPFLATNSTGGSRRAIAIDLAGVAHFLDPESGRPTSPPIATRVYPLSEPALADLDSDGRLEAVYYVADRQTVAVAFDLATGTVEERWRVAGGRLEFKETVAPVVANVAGDATPEILVSDVDRLLIGLDAERGETRFKWPLFGLPGITATQPSIRSEAEAVYCFSVRGPQARAERISIETDPTPHRWQVQLSAEKIRRVQALDLDGDRRTELFLQTTGNRSIAIRGDTALPIGRVSLRAWPTVANPPAADGKTVIFGSVGCEVQLIDGRWTVGPSLGCLHATAAGFFGSGREEEQLWVGTKSGTISVYRDGFTGPRTDVHFERHGISVEDVQAFAGYPASDGGLELFATVEASGQGSLIGRAIVDDQPEFVVHPTPGYAHFPISLHRSGNAGGAPVVVTASCPGETWGHSVRWTPTDSCEVLEAMRLELKEAGAPSPKGAIWTTLCRWGAFVALVDPLDLKAWWAVRFEGAVHRFSWRGTAYALGVSETGELRVWRYEDGVEVGRHQLESPCSALVVDVDGNGNDSLILWAGSKAICVSPPSIFDL